MSNSSLVSYTKISPNKTSPRNHKIDTITIHCVVGQAYVETLGDIFSRKEREASSNYGIGPDGRIGMYVEESDRSWCSSDKSNDNRAITIEVASDTTYPYAVTDEAYNSLIELCTDICKRNGIKELKWKGDKSLIGKINEQNMTVHRWFSATECPGDYLYERYGAIADAVNAKLNDSTKKEDESDKKDTELDIPNVPFMVRVLIDDLNYRSKPDMGDNVEGQTGKGTFTIVEVNNGWGRLKSGAGWIWLGNPKYTEIINPSEATENDEFKPFMVKVNRNDLNIRKGPGTNYDKTGNYTGIGVFTIVEIQNGKGSDSGWGRLKSGAGWISLDFCNRI